VLQKNEPTACLHQVENNQSKTENKMEEIIEQYLLGQLSKEEKAAFELRINTEQNLAKDVKIQRELMEAIKIQGLKADISNAYRQVKLGKMLKNAVITTLIAAVVGLGIYYIAKSVSQNNEPQTTGATLPSNDFTIDNSKDTVIETTGGIILHIPANAFGDIDNYELEVKEALNALDIMEAGLSTMSDSNLLATAGMFKITATKDGKELQLADGKEITAQVPTDEVDPDIMLFDGVEDSTGNINWVNPTQIKKHLINRSFDDLNFYPPGYLAKVSENGYDADNKKFTDSLYWSFDCGRVGEEAPQESLDGDLGNVNYPFSSESLIYKTKNESEQRSEYLRTNPFNVEKSNSLLSKLNREFPQLLDQLKTLIDFKEPTFNLKTIPNYNPKLNTYSKHDSFLVVSTFESSLIFNYPPKIVSTALSDTAAIEEARDESLKQICPASIKALQTKRFAKTYIATKEFEQRLQHLFQVCDEASLNVYIQNLDKDISYADSIVALRIEGSKKQVFERFSAQKLGNTKSVSPAFAKLAAYHKKKKNAYDEAARKAREKVLSKYAKADKKQEYRTEEKQLTELKDRAENYQKELKTNLVEAYRQAGLPYPTPIPPKGTYTLTLDRTGWNNLDRYVMESTSTRTSLKTKYNGKDISIEYNPLSVQIENEDEYDFVRVYLIANKLPSYQKINKTGIAYKEKLNELFDYDLICLAQKSGDYYFYQKGLSKKPGSMIVSLFAKDKNEISAILNVFDGKQSNSLMQNLEYESNTYLYNQDLEKRKEKEAFRREIEGVIWPCGEGLSCNEEIVREGEMLFAANCESCHALNTKVVGPALAGVIDKYEEDYEWLIAFTQNNQKLIKSGDERANAIYEEYNGAAMNIFENLTDNQILSIYSYIDCMSGSVLRVPSPASPPPEILKIVKTTSKKSSSSNTIESTAQSIPILPVKRTNQDTAEYTSPTTFPAQTNLFAHLKTEYPYFYSQLQEDFDLSDPTFHASFKVIHCSLKRTSFITASNSEKSEQYEVDMNNKGMKAKERKKFFELCAADCSGAVAFQ
jgi:mono/diheme cytochrome c family protein